MKPTAPKPEAKMAPHLPKLTPLPPPFRPTSCCIVKNYHLSARSARV